MSGVTHHAEGGDDLAPARPTTADILINLAGFQVAWLSLAVSAAAGASHWGILVALVAMAVHLARSPSSRPEVLLAVSAVVIGAAVETALAAATAVSPAASGPWPPFPPFWLLALWAVFATLLNVTLRPLCPHIVLQVCLGCLFVPLSYYAGDALGALTLLAPVATSLGLVGLAWAFALPLLMALARRLDGWR
ncbi:MAG: DUF2878 domain-containing protein [Hyphomicrobiaceae bacterium]|nr:DUF2878 domain-containing protein [Hyphomicrobiaceae bacterium]